MAGKKDQRKLQLAAGLLMVLAVIGVERMAVRPSGVYVVTEEGAKPFSPGMEKPAVLDEVNRVKSIREMATCAPESRSILTSRKGFTMTPEMAAGRVWILTDRQKGLYWLRFENDRLDLVIFLNDPDREEQSRLRAVVCDPELFRDPAGFISSRTDYPVFTPNP